MTWGKVVASAIYPWHVRKKERKSIATEFQLTVIPSSIVESSGWPISEVVPTSFEGFLYALIPKK